MGILRMNYRSQAIGRWVDVTVVYPTDNLSYYEEKPLPDSPVPAGPRRELYRPGMKFQTVYLIHGGGDDDSTPYRYTNIERYAQSHHVMLVTPDVSNSFGIDTAYGVKYMTFLTEELPVVIRSLFASSGKREDNFVMGFAMGGNVALGLALTRPDLYGYCVDMSGGIGMTLNNETLKKEIVSDHFSKRFPLFSNSFGSPENVDGSAFDLYAAVKRHQAEGVDLTPVDILCGADEFIRARVEDDVRILRSLDYPVRYFCPEGYVHDYRLWDDYFRIALDEWLPLKNRPIYPDKD